MALPRSLVAGALLVALSSTACRNKAGEGAAGSASTSAEPRADDGEAGAISDTLYDASLRFHDAGPRADGDPDAKVDPVCTGPEISFHGVVVDARCAIASVRAKRLLAVLEQDGGAALPLRQEATVLPDGRVTLRLVNTGPAPLTLPLSYSSKLPAFTALAEDDRHAIYELEAPRFEVGSGGPEAAAANERPHFARIVLLPGGAAVATVTPSAAIVRVLRGADAGGAGGKSPDGGPAAPVAVPARLGKGHYTLHLGELLVDTEAGAPARVGWDVP